MQISLSTQNYCIGIVFKSKDCEQFQQKCQYVTVELSNLETSLNGWNYLVKLYLKERDFS